MNATVMIRSGHERRQNHISFPEEVRRTGGERRNHGRSEDAMYDSLWETTKAVCKRLVGAR